MKKKPETFVKQQLPWQREFGRVTTDKQKSLRLGFKVVVVVVVVVYPKYICSTDPFKVVKAGASITRVTNFHDIRGRTLIRFGNNNQISRERLSERSKIEGSGSDK